MTYLNSMEHCTKLFSSTYFLVIHCTCVSVHRRDRCTRIFPHPYCTTKVQIFCTEFLFTKVQEHCTKSLFSFTFFLGSFRLVRASDTFCQDFVLVYLSIDVTGALVLLFYLHCTSWFQFHFLWFTLLFFSSALVCPSIDVTGALVLFLFLPCLLPASLLLSLFWLFSCTCVSVHRRDRCTCTLHSPLH